VNKDTAELAINICVDLQRVIDNVCLLAEHVAEVGSRDDADKAEHVRESIYKKLGGCLGELTTMAGVAMFHEANNRVKAVRSGP